MKNSHKENCKEIIQNGFFRRFNNFIFKFYFCYDLHNLINFNIV